MRIKKHLAAMLFILVLCLMAAPAGAKNVEVELKPVGPEPKAQGTVTLRQYGYISSDRILDMYFSNLKPDAVYSVWIYNSRTDKRYPAGLTGQNHFRTKGSGSGHYTAFTSEYDIDWKYIEVDYHPDGDPQNTTDMVVVLKARLYT